MDKRKDIEEIAPDTGECDDGVAYLSYRWLDPTILTLEIAESEGDEEER